MAGTRTSFREEDCGVSKAVDVIGEPWTLLILRDLFLGLKRYDDFQRHLGISPKVLANRLHTLTDAGIVSREADPRDRRSYLYRLTDKGMDLYPVMVALNQWGDRWAPKGKGLRIQLVEKATGQPIAGAAVVAEDGHFLHPKDVEVRPGPGDGAVFRELQSQLTSWRSRVGEQKDE